jgi:hypothetical protein
LGSQIEFARGVDNQGLRVRFWLPVSDSAATSP